MLNSSKCEHLFQRMLAKKLCRFWLIRFCDLGLEKRITMMFKSIHHGVEVFDH